MSRIPLNPYPEEADYHAYDTYPKMNTMSTEIQERSFRKSQVYHKSAMKYINDKGAGGMIYFDWNFINENLWKELITGVWYV